MVDEANDSRIDEEAAGLILERAAELDAARGGDLDLDTLRAAALEAGIATASFDRAVAELRSNKLHPVPVSGEAPPSPSGPAATAYRGLILAAGVSIGALAVLLWRGLGMDDGPAVIVSLIIAAATAIGLLLRRRPNRAVLDFEIDLGLLWAGVTVVLMLAAPADADQVLSSMGVLGAVAAAVGGVLVALPRGREPRELPEGT
jgi:hypothetical protein